MTTLLRPGIRKILYTFYKRKNERIHLRELARETNMHGQSITRYLAQLEKEKILQTRKEGNLKQYELAHNKSVYALLSLFDVEKVEKLPLLRKKAIDTYIKALPQPPIFMVVFGSTAKETYIKDSDIDILIITNAKIDIASAEKEVDAQCAMRVSTFQMTYPRFIQELKLKEEPVIQSAIQTGYPVINHLQYYEVLYHERV
ncbi:MAG: nucleotidyltransferase domain-containing protein [Nanoarchaeota archaeon]|nr:nucleotidyltransferase domain-containing protein [Nanoarchaeota archaeon]